MKFLWEQEDYSNRTVLVLVQMIVGNETQRSDNTCVLCVCVQLISVYSGNRLPLDLIVQLCDDADNPAPEENVRIQLTRDAAALKVYCTPIMFLSGFKLL